MDSREGTLDYQTTDSSVRLPGSVSLDFEGHSDALVDDVHPIPSTVTEICSLLERYQIEGTGALQRDMVQKFQELSTKHAVSGQRISALEHELKSQKESTLRLECKIESLNGVVEVLRQNMETVIGQLRDDVGHLQTGAGQLRGDVGHLQTVTGQLQGDVGGLQTGSGQLRGDVGHLQTVTGQLRSDVGTIRASSGEGRLDALVADVRSFKASMSECLPFQEGVRLRAGQTTAGSTTWQIYVSPARQDLLFLRLDVNIREHGFTSPPKVLVTRASPMTLWNETRAVSIKSVTTSSFSVYIEDTTGRMTAEEANRRQYNITYLLWGV